VGNEGDSTPGRVFDLGLGSNMGDRLANLQHAVDLLRDAGLEIKAVSNVYETHAVGGPTQGPFLNAVVSVRTDMAPRDLLELAHEIETRAGRVRTVRWGPRTLDIDLLRSGDLVLKTDTLTIPHPRMRTRAFVLAPLADVDPTVDLAGVDMTGVRRTDLRLV
jgi:2-amino-4-hydroxy-6-hydroxymethyldihydropteridine diphosphokinase